MAQSGQEWQRRDTSGQFTGMFPDHGKAKSAKEAFDLVMLNAGAGPQPSSSGTAVKNVKAQEKSTIDHHADPEADYPTATPDEIRHLRVLQEQKKSLLEQLRKQRTEKALVARQGLGAYYPKQHVDEPLLVLDNNRWHVIGHSEEKLVQIECNNREEVLVHKCCGVDHQIRIKILGPCSKLHIEECHNIKFIVDALLFAGAVSDSSAIEMVLGAEVPNLLLRNVRGCDITLCPENMDGGLETVNCSGVSVHSVFRGGFLALEPSDLMRAPTKYVAQIPDRVYTMMQGHQVVSECRGHRGLANATQAWWAARAAEVYGQGQS